MAQATLSCRFAAIHLAAALSNSPVDCCNRRGFSAEKRVRSGSPKQHRQFGGVVFCRDWPPGQSYREAAYSRRTVEDTGPYRQ